MTMKNRQIMLRERPVQAVGAQHFELAEHETPPLAENEALVRVKWLAIEPTQRTWLNPSPTYASPVELGTVMRGSGVGQVVASRSPTYEVGDWVYGATGWQDYCVAKGEGLYGLNRVPDGVEPKAMLTVFGVSGLTAYFGMTAVGAAGAGEAVFVSAAAGSVGCMAGQIAAIRGGRVIGSTSNRRKCRFLRDLAGFDEVVDYREEDLRQRLKRFAPEGLDVVFDNVGGDILEDALDNLAVQARVVLCGSIASGYRENGYGQGPANYMELAFRRARMEGFIFLDFADRFPAAFHDIRNWVDEGRLICPEYIVDGLQNAPMALQGLFEGRNLGKCLVRLEDDEGSA